MASVERLQELLEMAARERPVDLDAVRAALRDRDPACREAATVVAGRHLLELGPDLVGAWFRDPTRRPAVERMLAEDPLLVFEARRPELLADAPRSAPIPEVLGWFAPPRIRRALEALAEGLAAGADAGRPLLDRLPGLRQQAAHSPASPIPDGVRRELAAAARRDEARRFPRQVAVVPSYRCSRGCSYCFVKGRAAGAAELTATEVGDVLDTVLGRERAGRVNVFGGEPTELAALDAIIAEIERRHLSFYFSTNGLCEPARFRTLVSSDALELVTVHVERPESYSREEREVVLRNVAHLGTRRFQTVLRYNLVDPALTDWSFLEPLVRAAPRAYFSFAVVFPSRDRRNQYVPFEGLAAFVPKIVSLARAVRGPLASIPRVALAKPFPLCAFGADELRLVLSRVEYCNICEIDRGGFSDQITVAPDRTVSPCLAVGSSRLRLAEPAPLEELARRFEPAVSELVRTPLHPGCGACALHVAGVCQAGCYAYVER